MEQRRELVREVFEEIRIREGALVAVKPRPSYTPLFGYTLWRGQVVGGTGSSRACRRMNGNLVPVFEP